MKYKGLMDLLRGQSAIASSCGAVVEFIEDDVGVGMRPSRPQPIQQLHVATGHQQRTSHVGASPVCLPYDKIGDHDSG